MNLLRDNTFPIFRGKILDWNENARHDEIVINLRGAMIGNGWISPADQYLSYLPFALAKGLVRENGEVHQYLKTQQDICSAALDASGGKNRVHVEECNMFREVLRLSQKKKKPSGRMERVNMYDIELRDDYPSCGSSWPPQLPDLEFYLQRQDVLEALHIPSTRQSKIVECDTEIMNHFQGLNSTPSINLLPDLLTTISVVLFSGDQDFICNFRGTEALIDEMSWDLGQGFRGQNNELASVHDWIFDGDVVGNFQQARRLTYQNTQRFTYGAS